MCRHLSGANQPKPQNRITSHMWKRLQYFRVMSTTFFCCILSV
jgi:hypothetical protein